MKDLEDLCFKVQKKVCNARCIQSMIITEKFKKLWQSSTQLEKERISAIVLGNNKDEVDLWMKYHPSIELGELPIRRLRERARRLRVKNYCRLTKFELIREIKLAEKDGDI